MSRRALTELFELVLDEGSFTTWDTPIPDDHPLPTPYRDAWLAARAKTGCDEAVLTGEGTLRGRRIAVVGGEGRFLGGSIGVTTSERLTSAIERATREELPILAFPIGGGTRMQEGTIAFLQMVKITQAVTQHKKALLPYLVYLRHPTMGGVFASWGSLGHVQLAAPGAMIGFLGPKVYEALYGTPFPSGVQTAENMHEHGIVDALVAPEELAEHVHRILNVACARRERKLYGRKDAVPEPSVSPPAPDAPAWDSIVETRRPERPGVGELLAVASDVTMLNGTGDGDSHPGSVLALARFGTAPCVVLGQCRQGQTLDRPLDPGSLREARRGMRLSKELRLPLVTIIDTPGAALSKYAEERGLAGEIARALSDLVTLPTPTISVLMGQGSGGIALALAPCDRVLATEHAWLAPLPPEGASAIVHGDTSHAREMATAQGVRTADLLANGIVHRVVLEPSDREPDVLVANVASAITEELLALMRVPRPERLSRRQKHYRALGLDATGF